MTDWCFILTQGKAVGEFSTVIYLLRSCYLNDCLHQVVKRILLISFVILIPVINLSLITINIDLFHKSISTLLLFISSHPISSHIISYHLIHRRRRFGRQEETSFREWRLHYGAARSVSASNRDSLQFCFFVLLYFYFLLFEILYMISLTRYQYEYECDECEH